MYIPNNTPVYLKAYAGFMAGIGSSGNTDIVQGDYTAYGQMADAWAQEVDTQWGEASPTGLELEIIQEGSEALWENRSPPTGGATTAGAYTQPAQALVARVLQGNLQVVSEGIDPNGIESGPSILTVATGALLTSASVTALLQGALAYVVSYGAYWSLQPAASSPAPGGDVVLASNDPAQVWVRTGTGIPQQAAAQGIWNINSATGSNENDGLTTGTALKDFAEALRRWGTNAPRFAQDVTITWAGGDDMAQSYDFQPFVDGGHKLVLQTTPTLVATVTINGAGFQVKNTATGAQLHANLTSAGAVGQLLINLTHPSHAWVKSSLGANAFVISQPITVTGGAMVDTWATTDSVQLYSVPRVNLATFEPQLVIDNAIDNLIQLGPMVIGDPTAPSYNPFVLGPYVVMTDVRAERYWAPPPTVWVTGYATTHVNCAFDGSVISPDGVSDTVLVQLIAGYVLGSNFGEIVLTGINFDGGCIVDGTDIAVVNFQLGNCTLENVNLLGTAAVAKPVRVPSVGAFGASLVWGTWTLDVQGEALLFVQTTTFTAGLVGGTLKIAGLTTANSASVSDNVATVHTGIAINVTNLDAGAGAAGFGGTAFLFSGGAITNVGEF